MSAAQRRLPASLNDMNNAGLRLLGDDLGPAVGRIGFAGSWNCEIYPSLNAHVRAEDIHCTKNRVSGLWNQEQPLWKQLVKTGKRTLFFAGTATDVCVLATLTDAYNGGWDCVLVDDCCATIHEGAREVCVSNAGVSERSLQCLLRLIISTVLYPAWEELLLIERVQGMYGFVVDSEAFRDGKLE